MATPYNEQELPVLTRLWLEGAIPSWFDEVPRKYKAYFLKWAYESSLWGDEFLGFGEVDADEAMVAMDRHSVEGKSEPVSYANTTRSNNLSPHIERVDLVYKQSNWSLSILGSFCPFQTGITKQAEDSRFYTSLSSSNTMTRMSL
tara:strand:+ start:35782 stop:36216 length:435 start_codon:yes stop_codon:yes gene_type:complete